MLRKKTVVSQLSEEKENKGETPFYGADWTDSSFVPEANSNNNNNDNNTYKKKFMPSFI